MQFFPWQQAPRRSQKYKKGKSKDVFNVAKSLSQCLLPSGAPPSPSVGPCLFYSLNTEAFLLLQLLFASPHLSPFYPVTSNTIFLYRFSLLPLLSQKPSKPSLSMPTHCPFHLNPPCSVSALRGQANMSFSPWKDKHFPHRKRGMLFRINHTPKNYAKSACTHKPRH